LVARLRGRDEISGDRDVLPQQAGKLPAGGAAVDPAHRGADVVLVLEQPRDGRLSVRRAACQADDRETRPRHVVFPPPTHLVPERELAAGDRARLVAASLVHRLAS